MENPLTFQIPPNKFTRFHKLVDYEASLMICTNNGGNILCSVDHRKYKGILTFPSQILPLEVDGLESIEMLEATADAKGETGFGFKERPARGL